MLKLCLEPPVYKVGELYYSPTSAVIDSQGERSRLRARESTSFTNSSRHSLKSFHVRRSKKHFGKTRTRQMQQLIKQSKRSDFL